MAWRPLRPNFRFMPPALPLIAEPPLVLCITRTTSHTQRLTLILLHLVLRLYRHGNSSGHLVAFQIYDADASSLTTLVPLAARQCCPGGSSMWAELGICGRPRERAIDQSLCDYHCPSFPPAASANDDTLPPRVGHMGAAGVACEIKMSPSLSAPRVLHLYLMSRSPVCTLFASPVLCFAVCRSFSFRSSRQTLIPAFHNADT